MKKIKIGIILIFFLGIGILSLFSRNPLPFLRNGGVKKVKKSYFYPQKVYLTTKKGLFAFSLKGGEIKLLGFINETGLQGSFYNKYGIFTYRNRVILKYNYNLEKVAEVKLEKPISAFAGNEYAIFVSSGGYFLSFDENLKQYGKVPLKCGGILKDSHDILLYKKRAYILDNVIFPIYTFRMNIGNYQKPFIESQISISELNPHLKTQWLNPYLNQWGILVEYNARGVNGQVIDLYPMESGEEALLVKPNYSYSYFEKKEEGFKIAAITHLPPILGLGFENKKAMFFLLRSEDNTVSFKKYKISGLNLSDAGNYKLKKWLRNYVFLLNDSTAKIQYFSTFNENFLLLKTYDFTQFHTGGIIDVFCQ